MKITTFEIQLDNQQPVYYAGQTIAGRVHLELAAELDFRSITLALHGDANVAWSEQHGSGKNRRTVHYHNKETYVNLKLFLLGDGKDKIKIQPGIHDFPFTITLPPNLPSTFMGAYGKVMYFFKCNIDRPWKRDNNHLLYITIVSLYDLNLDPQATLPAENTKSKTFGCMCCTTGPLTARINLPKKGFVCGETIFFSADIENSSTKEMTKSSVLLIENDVFTASNGKKRHSKRVVMRHDEGRIEPGGSFTWGQIGLMIPPLAPSQLIYCNIIDIYYTIELSVDPSGIGFDLDVPVPIIIGTIPLRFQPISGAPPAPAAPPPSYQDTFHGRQQLDAPEGEDDSVQGGSWYTPQYPTYQFNDQKPPLPQA